MRPYREPDSVLTWIIFSSRKGFHAQTTHCHRVKRPQKESFRACFDSHLHARQAPSHACRLDLNKLNSRPLA